MSEPLKQVRGIVVMLGALVVACGRSADGGAAPRANDTLVAAAVPAAPSEPPPVLSGAGVGCVRIGDAMPTLRASCAVVSDTTVPGLEGMREQVVTVRVGEDVIPVTIVSDSVFRAVVSTPSLRTADSLGVGTTLGDLLARADATPIEGEGRLFVTLSSHCGLSFRLGATRAGRQGTTEHVVRTVLPRTTVVDRVLVVGCRMRDEG